MTSLRRENRGRGAAAGNRRALLAAAVEVFGEQGYDAPLSAVAKRAGVGQGSLYRHFPDRVALAVAVFEDNVVELEELAALPGTTLDALLDAVTDQLVSCVGFVDVVTASVRDGRVEAVAERVGAVLAGALPQAQAAGRFRDDVTAADVVLAIGMVAGLVAKVPPEDRLRTAAAAWALLRQGLRP
ncbi:TetR/AcrR family transcriptional regulator [Pseudonocardia broussonetiae]|uniref:TetR/AcrR family transcriptional regulator n=1 Tax=Pseudonocardia broussonetiae TaxID=2736640 RepID=UPI00196596F5|nr:TetR/AcrR family transcriptional regulator [Pseudonocardia broussonetiae]